MATDFSRVLRWYPSIWREQYEDDLVAYMQDSFGEGRPSLRAQLSLAAGGISERIRQSGLAGDSAPPGDRIRASTLVVLCSWTAFVIAGSNFAKLSEHFDQALPTGSGAHHLPDLAYTAIQVGAAVAGMAVIAGALAAAPALVRFLRSGGWSAIRRWVFASIASTAVVIATLFPLRSWAHHLSDSQRNGGSVGYEALFLTWAAAAAITLILWTGAAVAAARRLEMSRRLLRAEVTLGLVVATAMLAILAATGLWWTTLAERAPLFLSADPSTPVNGRLIASVIIMVVSAASASAGLVRITRSWRLL